MCMLDAARDSTFLGPPSQKVTLASSVWVILHHSGCGTKTQPKQPPMTWCFCSIIAIKNVSIMRLCFAVCVRVLWMFFSSGGDMYKIFRICAFLRRYYVSQTVALKRKPSLERVASVSLLLLPETTSKIVASSRSCMMIKSSIWACVHLRP